MEFQDGRNDEQHQHGDSHHGWSDVAVLPGGVAQPRCFLFCPGCIALAAIDLIEPDARPIGPSPAEPPSIKFLPNVGFTESFTRRDESLLVGQGNDHLAYH